MERDGEMEGWRDGWKDGEMKRWMEGWREGCWHLRLTWASDQVLARV